MNETSMVIPEQTRMLTPAEALRSAAAVFDMYGESGFADRHLATTAFGQSCDPQDAAAVAWSPHGALMLVTAVSSRQTGTGEPEHNRVLTTAWNAYSVVAASVREPCCATEAAYALLVAACRLEHQAGN